MTIKHKEKLDNLEHKVLDAVHEIMEKVAKDMDKFCEENSLDARKTVEFSGSFIISMTTTIIRILFNDKAALKDKLIFADHMHESVKKNLMHYSKKDNEKLN